jgi:dethiobiotin synthetase
LGKNEAVADIAIALELPVVLVAGMRLGCLNHALLSVESIQTKGAKLAGWVANQIDNNMRKYQQNVDSLAFRIDAPLLGKIPFCHTDIFATGERFIDITNFK